MEDYKFYDISDLLSSNPYPGRGIVIGKSEDGAACVAYFIMGRSENSRNRIFCEEAGRVFTKPFDATKVKDPSLIIYNAVREYGNNLIVTNGDHTDTIYDGLSCGKSFSEALKAREYEPDAPNFTPRISGMVTFVEDDFSYELSILKSVDSVGTACSRYTFSYASVEGFGHFIHTYMGDKDPLPSFCGEPHRIKISSCIDNFTDTMWNSLNSENKISLYVRYIDCKSKTSKVRIINKNKLGE